MTPRWPVYHSTGMPIMTCYVEYFTKAGVHIADHLPKSFEIKSPKKTIQGRSKINHIAL